MADDSDDFGLDNTGDLDIDHEDNYQRQSSGHGRAAQQMGDRLFSGDGDDDFGSGMDSLPSHGRSGAPPPVLARPSAPAPSHRRGSVSGVFSEGDNDESAEIDFSADHDFGGDHPLSHQLSSRPALIPAADYTDPSMSLDANDSSIADLLGPPAKSAPPPALPRPAPAPTAHPPAPAGASSDYGLDAEDSELAELLGEPSRTPPPPPAPAAAAPQPSLARHISFQEPIAVPLQRGPGGSGGARRPKSQSDYDSVEDVQESGDGFGLTSEMQREAVTGGRLGAQPSKVASTSTRHTSSVSVPQESIAEDYGSGGDYQGAGYVKKDSLSDSPFARSQPQLQARSREPSEPYEENFEEDTYDDFDREHGARDAASYRRVRAPEARGTPPSQRLPGPGTSSGPTDNYEEDYEEDDDDFADDISWDGEIRQSGGGAQYTRPRPGSAEHPRSRGPHATGRRRRPQSAMAPRERQAAMLEDMMSRHPSSWDIREVALWVEYIGMPQYRSKFVHHSVDGALLLTLGEPELARDMRILSLGHRRALVGAIVELREAAEAMEKERGEGLYGARKPPMNEAERLAALRRRAAERQPGRRPSSASAHIIPPAPFLGPAHGKTTVYEQRAKLLFQLDRARHRAAQHAAIIEQLANNKALTEAQMAELRGKLKDLEAKHRDELMPGHRTGMTAPVAPSPRSGNAALKGAAALAAAEYGPDAAIPWLPVGRGTALTDLHPERFARLGEDPALDLTFRPRVNRVKDVPPGPVRDIVSKALSSRQSFWERMDFEFEQMRKEREQREEARRKRRERMGVVKRGGEGEDEEQAKSRHWNNFWVPGSRKNDSYHKHFKRGSENEELRQYRGFAKDKGRLSLWFHKFVDNGESTEGDVALERLINRMIKALVKTKAEVDADIGDTFDKRIRRYFEERGYKYATHISNTVKVRARGTRPPGPSAPDNTQYDFEEVEQYYPDYLRKNVQAADDGGGEDDGNETRMVPKRTTWKRLVAIYYMDRQNKIRAAIAMVKMSQFVQRHGPRWPPERDRDSGNKAVWVPNSNAGALQQVDGRDRTFNEKGRENISLHAKLKKALGPPQPITYQMRMKEEEDLEAKAEALFAAMGWPHSSGDPELGPPDEPLLLPEDKAGEGGEAGFGLSAEEGDGERPGNEDRPKRRWTPPMDFFQALDAMLSRANELQRARDEWAAAWWRAETRGYGMEDLPQEAPKVEDLDWSGDPLMAMQQRAMERQREQWLLEWEKARRRRERHAAQLWKQGYAEEDIEHRLGPQQEADDVEHAVHNALFRYVELISRYKPQDLNRFREKLTGTKKKMAVYRALCTQMFLDDTRARERAREETVRAIYDSYRRGDSKRVTPVEVENMLERMQIHSERGREKTVKMLHELQQKEDSFYTPWFLRPRSVSPPPAQSPGRATSPNSQVSPRRPRSRSPGAASIASGATTPRRPRSTSRSRQGSEQTASRSKYVFGSSTPKSMWGPMGPVRRSGASSLLDSPSLQGLHSTVSVGGGAISPGHLRQGAATPTRQRPGTPTRSAGAGAGAGGRGLRDSVAAAGRGGGGISGVGGATGGRAQRPRSAVALPSPSGRLSVSAGGASAASTPRRPASAAPPQSPSRRSAGSGQIPTTRQPPSPAPLPSPSRGRTTSAATKSSPPSTSRQQQQTGPGAAPPSPIVRSRPVSAASGRYPASGSTSVSPQRRSTDALRPGALRGPPSPARSSGGGVLRGRGGAGGGPVRGGPAAGRGGARRGLMDGDATSGGSASPSPSPERRAVAGSPAARRDVPGAQPHAAPSQPARQTQGPATPSKQLAVVIAPTTRPSGAAPAPPSPAPQQSGPASTGAPPGQRPSRGSSGTGSTGSQQQPAQRQPAAPLRGPSPSQQPPSGLTPQGSFSSGVSASSGPVATPARAGSSAAAAGAGAGATGGPLGALRAASRSGSAAAPGSRRQSGTPVAPLVQQSSGGSSPGAGPAGPGLGPAPVSGTSTVTSRPRSPLSRLPIASPAAATSPISPGSAASGSPRQMTLGEGALAVQGSGVEDYDIEEFEVDAEGAEDEF